MLACGSCISVLVGGNVCCWLVSFFVADIMRGGGGKNICYELDFEQIFNFGFISNIRRLLREGCKNKNIKKTNKC